MMNTEPGQTVRISSDVYALGVTTIMGKLPWDSHAKLVIIDDLTLTPSSSALS